MNDIELPMTAASGARVKIRQKRLCSTVRVTVTVHDIVGSRPFQFGIPAVFHFHFDKRSEGPRTAAPVGQRIGNFR
jgi:hypothetical protein